jgi:TPR repeat protein
MADYSAVHLSSFPGIMKKIKVLFFAADPTAVLRDSPTPKLQLGEDVREIRQRIEDDGNPSVFDFDWRLATRPKDLIRAFRRTRPQVVHFSGHGNRKGLVFTAAGGYGGQLVAGAALLRAFEVFAQDTRLVVLSACFSRDQAESIAEVVGCAIGTPGAIADEDAIRFDAAFYGYLACGESVQSAFDKAGLELDLHGLSGTRPELLPGAGVDPTKLFLVPRFRRRKQGGAGAAILVTSAAVIASWPRTAPPPVSFPQGFRSVDCAAPSRFASLVGVPAPAPNASAAEDASEPASALAAAKALCASGATQRAFPIFKKVAQTGNAEALGLEAIAYITGQGDHHDPQLGVEKLRKAAGKGDLRSMHALATAYETGYGVKASQYYARHWLSKAAGRGDAEAMRRLGVMHRQAKSDSALYWLPRAVDAGSADARVDLGYMYDAGILVEQDTVKAVQQYTAAARAGSARGMYAVGDVYQDGMGVKKDPRQALAWFHRAVCAGSADAMNAIGEHYLHGQGVPADSGMATRWFRLANAAGSPSAAGKLYALKAPEEPRRWKGPVAWVLARLGVAETRPPLSCPR